MFDKDKRVLILVESPKLDAKFNDGDFTSMNNVNTQINDAIINKFKKYVYDNLYFKKYLCLMMTSEISKNKYTGHHVIPVCIYKIENNLKTREDAVHLADEDVNNFTVNLSYSNHILAHYYLCMCSKHKKFKFCCEDAFFWMTATKNKLLPGEQELISKLPYLDSLRDDWKRNMSNKVTGSAGTTTNRVSIYNTELNRVKFVKKEELDSYLSSDWILGGKPLSEEAKRKIGISNSVALKGKKHTEEYKKKVSETLKKNYQDPNSGNSKARDKLREQLKGKKRPKEIFEKAKRTKMLKNNGSYCSEETRRKMSKALKGKECAIKGKKLINNDSTEMFIDNLELKKYLDNGWKLGKIKRNK